MRKERKREHRKVISYMRKMNKQLAQDEYLGLNRFRVDMYDEDWDKYDDGSGGYLYITFKITDNVTGNTGYFVGNNYDYKRKISHYANDFLIRCSCGRTGHFPHLHYVAYDLHEIVPYDGNKECEITPEEHVINTYSWVKNVRFNCEENL